ncbi:hypothetical protein ACFW7J_21195 [Streptomyces sp. NPDC059525]|uniref:hypothetical protein n=1 Tax=Streptomyces sp. NPDC059525 TaxID=3346857 RepID=UPI00369FB0B1
MANLVYKRATDQQSTARQDLVLDEAGIEDLVAFRRTAAPPAASTPSSARSSASSSPRTDFDHVVRLGLISPTGSAEVDYGRAAGGVTTVPLYSARDVALLPVMVSSVDWRAVALTGPGCRSPLATLTPKEGPGTVFLAGVARIARVGRAAVQGWRRRHPDFPPVVGGTEVHPEFDTAAVVAWLLDHDKIAVPSAEPLGSLVLGQGVAGTRSFRLDDPHLFLSEDAAGEDRLSAWFTEADAESVAECGAGALGAVVRRLSVPGRDPLAVLGEARVVDRFRSPSGWEYVTLGWPAGRLAGWPAGLRGSAGAAGGLVRHGVGYAAPGPECRCRRYGCGGIVPVSVCVEHGKATDPAMEWHPGNGIRCTALALG